MTGAAQVPPRACRQTRRSHPRAGMPAKPSPALRTRMFKRLTAALPYRLVTISQALSPLVVIGVLACLSVPNIALSGDDHGAPGGCPNTGTGDPAPCLADDGSQVSTTPPPAAPAPNDPGPDSAGAGPTDAA